MNIHKKTKTILEWLLKIIAAIIMLQTLAFKFTGAKESVYIFTTLGVEPWGRIGTGIFELIASILLFVPRFVWLGAIIGLGIIFGALISHFTILGIEVQNDKGQLFILGCVTFICLLILMWLHRKEIPFAGKYFEKYT